MVTDWWSSCPTYISLDPFTTLRCILVHMGYLATWLTRRWRGRGSQWVVVGAFYVVIHLVSYLCVYGEVLL